MTHNYIGKICPFCQFPVKNDINLVICSTCGIPHHLECWELNGGCTIFGCKETTFHLADGKGANSSLNVPANNQTADGRRDRGINVLLGAALVITLLAFTVVLFSYINVLSDRSEATADLVSTANDNGQISAASEKVQHYGFTMVQVGKPGFVYTIPTGTDDSGEAQVIGGFEIATTPVIYDLWYEVRMWAIANGYNFENDGREGSNGTDGAAPTSASNEPVTNINARDAMVWLNALSAMFGLEPVYRANDGSVIRDSSDSNAAVIDKAVQTENNGYRLPTSIEWETAARWKNDTVSNEGSIQVGGRFWTPGNYASGANHCYENIVANDMVAWYQFNSDVGEEKKTQPVGQKRANALGLYDMSGNVWEHCLVLTDLKIPIRKLSRGGSWNQEARLLQVGLRSDSNMFGANEQIGFRIARTP